MESLPSDVIALVALELQPKQVLRLTATSSRLRDCIMNEIFWKSMVSRLYWNVEPGDSYLQNFKSMWGMGLRQADDRTAFVRELDSVISGGIQQNSAQILRELLFRFGIPDVSEEQRRTARKCRRKCNMLRDLLRRYRTNEGQIGGRSHGRLTVVYSSIIYCPHMNLISHCVVSIAAEDSRWELQEEVTNSYRVLGYDDFVAVVLEEMDLIAKHK